MKRKLTINDVIHFYLSHYCDSFSTSTCATMWSEMNEIKDYYLNALNGSKKYSIQQIIKMCIIGLYSNGHQKRLDKESINKAVDIIENTIIIVISKKKYTLFDAIRKNKLKIIDFEELYEIIKNLIGGISGIGYVTIYDTARRIGHILNEPIYPQAYVYLHYNKVNFAARSILNRDLKYREPSILFYNDFGTFPSICIEDILCIFSGTFVKILSSASDNDGTVKQSKKNNWKYQLLDEFIKVETDRYKRRSATRWQEFPI